MNIERVTRITSLQIEVALGYLVCILLSIYYVLLLGGPAWIWFLSLPIVIAALISFLSWYRFRDAPRPKKVSDRAIRSINVAITIYGFIWGMVLYVLSTAAEGAAEFLLIIAIGISSTAIILTYYLPIASLVFGALCITPVIVSAGRENPNLIPVFLGLYIVYFLASTHGVLVSYRVLRNNLQLRVQNEELLKVAQDASNSKNNFIASMSHELRTPLNAISGYAQLVRLAKDDSNPEKLERSMENILDASSHLTDLIEDVLNISKLESDQISQEPRLLSPKDEFNDILPMIQKMAQDKAQTCKGIISSDKQINVDPLRFRQVLINLLNNAVKYTPDNGSFEYGCYELEDDELRIYVSDTGIGIPEDDQPHIFEQFHRASNVVNLHPGTGLGLYHSKRLIEDMGGRISFESVESGGTSFFVDFPTHRSAPIEE